MAANVVTADNIMRCEPKMTKVAHREGPQQFARYIDAIKREKMQDEGTNERTTGVDDTAGQASGPLADVPPRLTALEGKEKCIACWKLAKRSCYTCREPYCDTCGKSEDHRTACSTNAPEDLSCQGKPRDDHAIQAIECDDDGTGKEQGKKGVREESPPHTRPHLTDTKMKETNSRARNFCPHCGQKISECECTDTDTEPEPEPQWPCEACGVTHDRMGCPTCYQKLCCDCFPPVCHEPPSPVERQGIAETVLNKPSQKPKPFSQDAQSSGPAPRDDGITSSHPCYLAASGPEHRAMRCNGELCMYLESPEDKGERMVPIVELLQARDDDAVTNALLEERSSWYKDAEKELVEAHELRVLIIRLLKENGGGLRNEEQTPARRRRQGKATSDG